MDYYINKLQNNMPPMILFISIFFGSYPLLKDKYLCWYYACVFSLAGYMTIINNGCL